MEVKMKVVFLCCVLVLAGSVSASSVEADRISLPEWVPDNIAEWILELISNLPDSIQNIIDQLPNIIAAIPDILDRIQEIIELIIERVPEIIQNIIDSLPEIIAQIPALIERIREILRTIIDRLPELIPAILDKIPELIEAIPGILESIKEIYDRIREILEELDLPDWFPSLPELEKPEWWPDELPSLPEYNTPTPGAVTTVNDYPGIVQIEVGVGPIWSQGCAGSVLTSVHVLSAARCFSGRRYNPRFRRVRAGSSTRYNGGLVVNVENAVNHPDFQNELSDADITVVRLATSLILGTNIQQTSIVPQDFSIPAGIYVELVGWGFTTQGRLFTDRNLYQISLSILDNSSCQERWNPFLTVSERTVCVADPHYGGRNVDVRDLGAPVYYQHILAGIVSLGAPVGNQYFPVVTTSVASFTNWIVANAV